MCQINDIKHDSYCHINVAQLWMPAVLVQYTRHHKTQSLHWVFVFHSLRNALSKQWWQNSAWTPRLKKNFSCESLQFSAVFEKLLEWDQARLKATCSYWSKSSEKAVWGVVWWSERCELSSTGLTRLSWHLLLLSAVLWLLAVPVSLFPRLLLTFGSRFKHHVDIALLLQRLYFLFFPQVYCVSGRSCDLDPRPYLYRRKVSDLALKTVFNLCQQNFYNYHLWRRAHQGCVIVMTRPHFI